jgi:hypothetical protein
MAWKFSQALVTDMGTEANARSGSTNATAVTTGWSELWQQDIEQFIISAMPCSQSMCEFRDAGVFG